MADGKLIADGLSADHLLGRSGAPWRKPKTESWKSGGQCLPYGSCHRRKHMPSKWSVEHMQSVQQ